MNPNPNPNLVQDAIANQYIIYDNWLYQERVRNWSAYTAYCQYKHQQQQKQHATQFRIQQLQFQIQQEYQQRQLQLQRQKEQADSEAEFQSYVKEIDELRTEELQEPEPVLEPTYVSTEADCWDIPEKFQPTQEKKWRKEIRRDRRQDNKYVVDYYKQVREGIPPAPEVSRAEHFNANKPPRLLRYESAQKRKTKNRRNQRTYGSGWAKQLE
jgi:hypothetical protein